MNHWCEDSGLQSHLDSYVSTAIFLCACVLHAKCFSDCSSPFSSVHGILQARILEWVAMPSSRASSRPRDRTQLSCFSCTDKLILYHQRHLGSPYFLVCCAWASLKEASHSSFITCKQQYLVKCENLYKTSQACNRCIVFFSNIPTLYFLSFANCGLAQIQRRCSRLPGVSSCDTFANTRNCLLLCDQAVAGVELKLWKKTPVILWEESAQQTGNPPSFPGPPEKDELPGGLAYCGSWCCKKLDTTERLN